MTTIFLDMDGVVADFEAYANRVLHKHDVDLPPGHKYPSNEWQTLRQYQRMYRDLQVIPGATNFAAQVQDIAARIGADVKFLTAVPSGNDMPWAFTDKVQWAAKHFPGIPVWFGPYSDDKHIRANGNILIDDRISNINQWRQGGGTAIHFVGNFTAALEQLSSVV